MHAAPHPAETADQYAEGQGRRPSAPRHGTPLPRVGPVPRAGRIPTDAARRARMARPSKPCPVVPTSAGEGSSSNRRMALVASPAPLEQWPVHRRTRAWRSVSRASSRPCTAVVRHAVFAAGSRSGGPFPVSLRRGAFIVDSPSAWLYHFADGFPDFSLAILRVLCGNDITSRLPQPSSANPRLSGASAGSAGADPMLDRGFRAQTTSASLVGRAASTGSRDR
jgi:hypothetical protein